MVAGVAVIGTVAAIVALAVALRVAREEELAFEAVAAGPPIPWRSDGGLVVAPAPQEQRAEAGSP